MDKVINFFKEMHLYDEDLFQVLINNTKILDRPYEEIKDFIGCFVVNGNIRLVLPKIHNEMDILIYIHEYTHALFIEDRDEIFPNIMEAIYVQKYFTEEQKGEFINRTRSMIATSESENHIIGNEVKLNILIQSKDRH